MAQEDDNVKGAVMKKILFVGDNISFLSILLDALSKTFKVYTATGVLDALSALADQSVDCICSDFNMVDGTGLELLERLYSNGMKITFLLMSGTDDSQLMNTVQSYGAVFVCKTDRFLLDKIKSL